jgi:hypothetical protein
MKDYSQIIDFISDDTKANANCRPLRVLLPSFVFLIIFVPVLVSSLEGGGASPGLNHAWPFVLIGALIIGSLVAFGKSLFAEKTHWLFWSFLLLILFATLSVPGMSGAFMSIPPSQYFWNEALSCFVFGSAVSAVTSAGLIMLTRFKGPISTRVTRITLSAMGSITGLCALFYHCPNAEIGHLLAGHGAQFITLLGLTFAINEIIFVRLIKKQLGSAAPSFANLSSFDKH